MNCRPGILAVVVRNGAADFTPGILDRVVEVIRPACFGDVFRSVDGKEMHFPSSDPSWVIRSAGPLPWKVGAGKHEGEVWYFAERAIADCYLRPITGLPIDEEAREELTA